MSGWWGVSTGLIRDPKLRPEEDMTKYQQLDATLHDNRYKPPQRVQQKTVASNTKLERRGENIAVVLYSTTIMLFRPNGTVTLANGGWDTPTTKTRMNSFLGDNLTVYSDRGTWHVEAKQTETMKSPNGVHGEEITWTHPVTYTFYDGISFDIETGLLAWNPRGWTPMAYVTGMVSAPTINLLTVLESSIEEALLGRTELTAGFIDQCLAQRERIEDKYRELRDLFEHEMRQVEWHLETTLERTMEALKQVTEKMPTVERYRQHSDLPL